MNEQHLKSCPHCGGAAYLEQNYSYKARSYFVFVKCSICGAQGKVYNTEEEPAAEWNNSACNAAAAAWNMRIKEQEAGNNGKE